MANDFLELAGTSDSKACKSGRFSQSLAKTLGNQKKPRKPRFWQRWAAPSVIQQSGQTGEVSQNLRFFCFLVFSMVLINHLVEFLVFSEIFGFLDVYALSVTPRPLGWAGRLAIRCITILHCHGAGLETSPQGLCDLSLSPIWISGSICNI